MNPTIIIKSDTDELSGPPREALCSVWPISQDEDRFEIGEPIFSNHMVMIGAPVSEERGSVLRLPQAGAYLVDIGYSNGSSLRTTIAVGEGQDYQLVVNLPNRSVAATGLSTRAFSYVPRVLSAAPRRLSVQKNVLQVCVISQSVPVPLSGLHAFATSLRSVQATGERVFEQPESSALTHELMVPTTPQEQLNPHDLLPGRQWLMVSSRGKPHSLVAFPHSWSFRNGTPFKLIMKRKASEGGDTFKWSTSLQLMDPVYGSLVEYLTRGDLLATRSISESERGKAASALYKKAGNPFSAAAAAYVFALAGTSEQSHQTWMETLSSRFQWLPDSAIALGWKTLRDGPDDTTAWERALHLFSMAFSRGLPYYTIGLHILVDALTLLMRVRPGDPAILQMLGHAKAADVACVRTEPFTTLQVAKYLGLPMKHS